jgi:hypothetical protein
MHSALCRSSFQAFYERKSAQKPFAGNIGWNEVAGAVCLRYWLMYGDLLVVEDCTKCMVTSSWLKTAPSASAATHIRCGCEHWHWIQACEVSAATNSLNRIKRTARLLVRTPILSDCEF